MKKLRTLRNADDPEFSTIRRKLARWAADNVRIIKDLKPPQKSYLRIATNASLERFRGHGPVWASIAE